MLQLVSVVSGELEVFRKRLHVSNDVVSSQISIIMDDAMSVE
jgi:hypothetical protein